MVACDINLCGLTRSGVVGKPGDLDRTLEGKCFHFWIGNSDWRSGLG